MINKLCRLSSPILGFFLGHFTSSPSQEEDGIENEGRESVHSLWGLVGEERYEIGKLKRTGWW